ncbi:putative invertase inhibitor [Malania oleifera]|uniref:putative invertase inhibitor n=1 Tax=Malania oleifera TaxID=397392 RepID=UPI0025AECD81|nr:putative invertase inhibitor [Malania oleifera]
METHYLKITPLVFLLLISRLWTNARADLVEDACSQVSTGNYDLCISSLRSDPSTNTSTDVKGLAYVMLGVLNANATAIVSRASELLNKTDESVIQQCLDDCAIGYSKVTADFIKLAYGFLNSSDYGSAVDQTSSMVETAEDCEDCFVGPPSVRKSPITAANNVFEKLATIAGDIIAILG